MPSPKRPNFKIAIVGDGAIGKTSLCIVFATARFPEIYTPVVCENYTCDVVLDGVSVDVTLWDTASFCEVDRLHLPYYTDVDAILLCFSVNNPDSCDNIGDKWAPELHHYCPRAPVILVGCKADLRGDQKEIDELARINQQFVTLEEAMTIARQIGATEYRECSAKTGTGVHEAFEAAASEALRIRNQKSIVQKLSNQCVVL